MQNPGRFSAAEYRDGAPALAGGARGVGLGRDLSGTERAVGCGVDVQRCAQPDESAEHVVVGVFDEGEVAATRQRMWR